MGAFLMAGTAAIGLGMEIFGGMKQMDASKSEVQAQQQITQAEMWANAARQNAMQVDARRRQLEIIRTQQRARALGLATATSQQGQGAQSSSGLFGGYGQTSGQTNTNLQGVQGALATGQNLFDISNIESEGKMKMAAAQGEMAEGAAISSFGGALMGQSSNIAKVGVTAGAMFI